MISGRQALGSIDQTLNQANQQIADLQSEIGDSSQRLLEEKRAQAEDYRELATVRLDRLAGDRLIQTLDHAERQAVALLEQRSDALNALQVRISESQRIRTQREQERQQQAARLDEAVAAVDQAEAKTQARLDQDEAYRAQRARVEEAERKVDKDKAAKLAKKLKLGVNAGHGLCYNSIKAFKGLSEIDEYSIGHSIVARAALVGMDRAVRQMRDLIDSL